MMASPVGSSQTAKDLAPPDRSATLSEPVTPTSGSKQQSKLEYKAQRKQYDMEKKQRRNKAMRDRLDVVLGDPTMKGWIKIRSRLKIWHKYWGVIYPGKLVLYEDDNYSSWKGTIILANMQVQERPTKKSGFSWKCTTEFGQDIFARKGPHANDYFHNLNILPTEYAILRVASEDLGRAWMVEIVKQQISTEAPGGHSRRASVGSHPGNKDDELSGPLTVDDDVHPLDIEAAGVVSETSWTDPRSSRNQSRMSASTHDPIAIGLECQRTTVSDAALEDFWKRMESTVAGQDAGMKSFPAGLIDSQSLLGKLADPFTMSSLLADAAKAPDANGRIIGITRWFLAGLCTRTPGIPILPVVGEVYRCAFNPSLAAENAGTFQNRTFVLCEQVKSDPPTSAIVATNREAGWYLSGSVSGRTRLWGNSVSVETESTFRLVLLGVEPGPEQYIIEVPHVKLKGLLAGRTLMEFVGSSSIECADTHCRVKLNFNKGQNVEDAAANSVRGQFLVRDVVVGSITGVWSRSVELNMSDNSAPQVILANDNALKQHISPKRTVSSSASLLELESSRVWQKAMIALNAADDDDAEGVLSSVHGSSDPSSNPQFFQYENSDDGIDTWSYKYLDLRPWSSSDVYTIEKNGKITTMTKSECGEIYSTVRETMPSPTPADSLGGTLPRTNSMLSRSDSRRESTRLSLSAYSAIEPGDDVPVDARIAALEARVREVEGHADRFQRVYVPLIGVLFALIQILLPIFVGLVFGVQL